MLAALSLMTCPSLTMTFGSLIATLPPSTPAFMPSCANSEITGPGANGVGPAGIVMSVGAVCPGLAAAGDLFFFNVL